MHHCICLNIFAEPLTYQEKLLENIKGLIHIASYKFLKRVHKNKNRFSFSMYYAIKLFSVVSIFVLRVDELL